MSCGCCSNAARAAASASRSRCDDVGASADRYGDGDARPGELREARDLDRVGVGERHRVAAAAVEGVAQVQHLGAQRAGRGRAPRSSATSSRRRPSARSRRPARRPRRRTGAAAPGRRAPARRSRRTRHRRRVDVGVARLVHRRRRAARSRNTGSSASAGWFIPSGAAGEEGEQVEVGACRPARRPAGSRALASRSRTMSKPSTSRCRRRTSWTSGGDASGAAAGREIVVMAATVAGRSSGCTAPRTGHRPSRPVAAARAAYAAAA